MSVFVLLKKNTTSFWSVNQFLKSQKRTSAVEFWFSHPDKTAENLLESKPWSS